MSSFIEKGYGWPLFVVVLLVSSVVMMGLVVMAARSDGGAQVVDDYYQQAVNFDSLAQARSNASALGWTSELAVARTETGLTGTIILADSTGAPVSGYDLEVVLRRPQLAQAVASVRATPGNQPGEFVFSSSATGQGLWDISAFLTASDTEGDAIQLEWRREVR